MLEGSQEEVCPVLQGEEGMCAFVSVKPPSQTQSCKEPEAGGGRWEVGGGQSLTRPQHPLCPQACNCDQYLKVSKDMMKQLVRLSSRPEGPSITGMLPHGVRRGLCGLCGQWPSCGVKLQG